MSARTIITLANGKNVDLLDPHIEASDFPALAEHLAKEKRFNGATPGREYSVAEHCCLGSDHAYDQLAAAYFLLHDAHEALWKDDTTPKKRALAEIAAEHFGIFAGHVMATFQLATFKLDAAIHKAAGLEWPAPPYITLIVSRLDKTMFVTEWRDLMGGQAHPDWSEYEDVEPLTSVSIERPWPWHVAMRAWMRRAETLLPVFANKVPA